MSYFSLFVLILLSLGVYDLLYNMEESKCEMTYMYRVPEFIPVNLSQRLAAAFPCYGLYVYGEGWYAQRLSTGAGWNGAPVLFIPGNAGSYKQVRSLGSVAQMMAEDSGSRQLLNVFTVDLGDDMAAVSGRLLHQQSRFVAHCVDAIVALYPAGHSVTIVAHSMGGVVARALFAQPGFRRETVRIIYALASPLARPAVFFDGATRDFYDAIDRDQRMRPGGTKALSDVTVVSIAGGERDRLVALHHTLDNSSAVSTLTEAVPTVWTSADHQCIVWCRHLVLSVTKSLFDLVAPGRGAFTSHPDRIRSVIQYYFVRRPYGKRWSSRLLAASADDTTVKLNRHAQQIHLNGTQFSYEIDRVRRASYLVWSLPTASSSASTTAPSSVDQLFIVTGGVTVYDWLFACSAPSSASQFCVTAQSLSGWSQMLPPTGNAKRRSVLLSLTSLRERGLTRVIIALMPTDHRVYVYGDASAASQRLVTAPVPQLTSVRAFLGSHTALPSTAPAALIYNISLQGLVSMWQAVRVTVTPVASCRTAVLTSSSLRPLARFHIPRLVSYGFHMARSSDESVSVVAQLPLATSVGDTATTDHPYVEVHLNPLCTYSVHVQNSLAHMAGQLAHMPLLVPALAAVVMATLAEQLLAGAAAAAAPAAGDLACHRVVLQVTPLKLAAPLQLTLALVGYLRTAAPALPYLCTWLDDSWPSQLPLLPLGALLVARSLLWAWFGLCHAAIVVVGYLLQHFVTGVFARAGVSEWVAEGVVTLLLHHCWLVSAALCAVALSSCGTVALLTGCLVCWIKVFRLHEERMLGASDDSANGGDGDVNVMTSLAHIWSLVTVINMPSLVVWSLTRIDSRHVLDDPSLIPALFMCAGGAVLWRDTKPSLSLKWSRQLAWLVRAVALVTVSRDLASWHVIGGWLCAVFVTVGVHQQLATSSTREASLNVS